MELASNDVKSFGLKLYQQCNRIYMLEHMIMRLYGTR